MRSIYGLVAGLVLAGSLIAQGQNPWPAELIRRWAYAVGVDEPADPADTVVFQFYKDGRVTSQRVFVEPTLSGVQVRTGRLLTGRWRVRRDSLYTHSVLCAEFPAWERSLKCATYVYYAPDPGKCERMKREGDLFVDCASKWDEVHRLDWLNLAFRSPP